MGGACLGVGGCQLTDAPLPSPHPAPPPHSPRKVPVGLRTHSDPCWPLSHLQEVRQGFPSLEKSPAENAVRCLWLPRHPVSASSLRHHEVSLAPAFMILRDDILDTGKLRL